VTRLRLALPAAVVLGVLLVSGAGAGTGETRAPSVTSRADLDRSILVEINVVRRARGLPALRPSAQLATAASRHSHAMAAKGFFRHEGADGSAFWRRIRHFYRAQGYRSWHVGENLLWMSPDVDAKKAVSLWLESPGHRKILFDRDYRELGLSAIHALAAPGDFRGLDVTIVTADFGSRVR
jgi:uncharacterized protein YkwD